MNPRSPVLLFVLVAFSAGCAGASERVGKASSADTEDPSADADAVFQSEYAMMVAPPNPDDPIPASVKLKGIPFVGHICDALAPFRGYEQPYFYYGAYLQGGTAVVGLLGTDIVFDLWNRQVAAFRYAGGGVGSQFGGEAGAYLGWGFGNKATVIDAWSGSVYAASVSVGLPWVELSLGATEWASADGTVIGGAAVGSFGLDLVPTPVDAFGTFGVYQAWNDVTRGISRGRSIGSTPTGEYIQFGDRRDMARYILETVPDIAAAVAAATLAISIARDFGGVGAICGWR
jgi:hypothetical protein